MANSKSRAKGALGGRTPAGVVGPVRPMYFLPGRPVFELLPKAAKNQKVLLNGLSGGPNGAAFVLPAGFFGVHSGNPKWRCMEIGGGFRIVSFRGFTVSKR